MFEVGKDILQNGHTATANDNGRQLRLSIIYRFFILLFCVFIIRTLYLGVQGTSRVRRGNGDSGWVVSRADIIDRNGDILAKNITSGKVFLQPPRVSDKDAVARLIHNIFPDKYSVSDALALINSDKKFMYLDKDINENQRHIIQTAKLPGLEIEEIQKRKYPKRRLFSHTVGLAGNDGHGLEGAERIFDKYLTENTDPLQLSLDSRIQSVFYEKLSIAMEKYHAKAAMGMLMNSRTGEMIAMVSLPDFDPESFGAASTDNRTFTPLRGVFEMGSIFKIFNTAMAFENGINREYYIEKSYKVLDKFGRTAASISDVATFKPPRPNLSVSEIMLYSCNAGSAQIALDLPYGTQQEFFERINMSKPLDLEFGKTEYPLLPQKWGQVERATVSFGHGIAVSPMHVLLAVNAMTNGGIYIYPTLKKRGLGEVSGSRVISEDISLKLRNIMFHISEETTAKKARIAGINIGGKTGTAEKYVNGKKSRKNNITVFVGAFPIEAPQYTIMILLDEPQGTTEDFNFRTAAWNAVPTAGKILDSTLPLLFE